MTTAQPEDFGRWRIFEIGGGVFALDSRGRWWISGRVGANTLLWTPAAVAFSSVEGP